MSWYLIKFHSKVHRCVEGVWYVRSQILVLCDVSDQVRPHAKSISLSYITYLHSIQMWHQHKIADIMFDFVIYVRVINIPVLTLLCLHVPMGGPHGLNSTINVLQVFLVPPLSSQSLQSRCDESRTDTGYELDSTMWKEKRGYFQTQQRGLSEWSHSSVILQYVHLCLPLLFVLLFLLANRSSWSIFLFRSSFSSTSSSSLSISFSASSVWQGFFFTFSTPLNNLKKDIWDCPCCWTQSASLWSLASFKR